MKWIDFFARKSKVETRTGLRDRLPPGIGDPGENSRAASRREAARREALIEFGGAEQAKEECRQRTPHR